jgi:hypothetical protein
VTDENAHKANVYAACDGVTDGEPQGSDDADIEAADSLVCDGVTVGFVGSGRYRSKASAKSANL